MLFFADDNEVDFCTGKYNFLQTVAVIIDPCFREHSIRLVAAFMVFLWRNKDRNVSTVVAFVKIVHLAIC